MLTLLGFSIYLSIYILTLLNKNSDTAIGGGHCEHYSLYIIFFLICLPLGSLSRSLLLEALSLSSSGILCISECYLAAETKSFGSLIINWEMTNWIHLVRARHFDYCIYIHTYIFVFLRYLFISNYFSVSFLFFLLIMQRICNLPETIYSKMQHRCSFINGKSLQKEVYVLKSFQKVFGPNFGRSV